MKRQVTALTLLASATFFGLAGCGKGIPQIVSDANLNSYVQDGDAIVELTVGLDLGSLRFPTLQFPILDPNNAWNTLGSISLRPRLDGKNEIFGSIDVTRLAQLSPVVGQATLPNGMPIPVGGLSGTPVFDVRVGGGSHLYLAVNNQSVMLGYAIAIRELDGIGSQLPGVSLFPSFKIQNGIQGLAGVFTGASSGQNGVAVFVDATRTLPTLAPELKSMVLAKTRAEVPFNYAEPTSKTSRKVQDRLMKKLWKLQRKGGRVSLH